VKIRIKRLLSGYIDLILIIVIANLIVWILSGNLFYSTEFEYILYFLATIGILTKDLIFRNKSIGKKILGLEVKNNDNTTSSILKIILRNITYVFWPIEGLIVLISNKRIGDIVFKTKVVEKK